MKKFMSVLGIVALLLSPTLEITYAFTSPITIKLANTSYVGNKTSIPLTVSNDYTVGGTSVTLQSGINYTVNNNNNVIEIDQGTTKIASGTSLQIIPSAYNYSNTATLNKGLSGQKSYLGNIEFKAEGGYVRPYNTLELEDYLKGVVPSEMSDSWGSNGGEEALKVQAVAARTYAARYTNSTIDDTTSYQVYDGYHSTYTNANNAVDSTNNQVVTYNNAMIDAVFSASNGGYIESNRGAWGSVLVPYLSAKPDKFDAVEPFTYSITEANLLANSALMGKIKGQINNQQVTDINSITPTQLTDGQRPKYLIFNVTTSTGTIDVNVLTSDVRSAIGATLIKSNYIKSITNSNGTFTFSGAGYGHGVGMSQTGAYKMSQLGYDYKNVLGFYYPGTQLRTGSVYENLTFTDKDTTTSNPAPSTPPSTTTPTDTTPNYAYKVNYNEPTINVSFNAPASGNIDIGIYDSKGTLISQLKPRVWESAGQKNYSYVNPGLNGTYAVTLRYANASVVQNLTQNITFNTDNPTFTSATSSVSGNVLTANYNIDKTGSILVEVVDVQGKRMAVLNPYEQKNAGTYSVSKTLGQLNGDYTVRFSVYDSKGQLSDEKEVAVHIDGNIPSYGDQIKTASANQQVNVYSDELEQNKIGTFYTDETMKVLRNIENSNLYEVEYNGQRGFVNSNSVVVDKQTSLSIAINGYNLMMDSNPVIQNNRTLVPARWVSSGLGFDSIVWDGTNQKAVMKKGNTTIELPFQKNYAYVNGAKVALDSTIQAYDGRLFVPLRFVSEQIGAQVSYDGVHNMIWLKQ